MGSRVDCKLVGKGGPLSDPTHLFLVYIENQGWGGVGEGVYEPVLKWKAGVSPQEGRS